MAAAYQTSIVINEQKQHAAGMWRVAAYQAAAAIAVSSISRNGGKRRKRNQR